MVVVCSDLSRADQPADLPDAEHQARGWWMMLQRSRGCMSCRRFFSVKEKCRLGSETYTTGVTNAKRGNPIAITFSKSVPFVRRVCPLFLLKALEHWEHDEGGAEESHHRCNKQEGSYLRNWRASPHGKARAACTRAIFCGAIACQSTLTTKSNCMSHQSFLDRAASPSK